MGRLNRSEAFEHCVATSRKISRHTKPVVNFFYFLVIRSIFFRNCVGKLLRVSGGGEIYKECFDRQVRNTSSKFSLCESSFKLRALGGFYLQISTCPILLSMNLKMIMKISSFCRIDISQSARN
jgi:hypothetical protein